MKKQRLIVGITGASGVIYGIRMLQMLRDTSFETHLVMSKSADLTLQYETDLKRADVEALADEVHAPGNVAASISSGSFQTTGMIIAPCTVRTMSEISTGVTSSLMSRAADVVLKDRRKLVLMVRETPFHLGHLRTMTQLAEMGAIIAPPVPAFYHRPESLDAIINQSVGRVLDLFDVNIGDVNRWGEDISTNVKSNKNQQLKG